MTDAKNNEEIYESYFGEGKVRAVISVDVDTKYLDELTKVATASPFVKDVFLVTGDTDLIIRASFESYVEMKDFIIKTIANVPGVQNTKSMMIVSAYKVNGKAFE